MHNAGDVATAWYVILSGSVTVQISKTGRIEDSFVIKTINKGEGFGELALVNDALRSATIVTCEDTELLRVGKVIIIVLTTQEK